MPALMDSCRPARSSAGWQGGEEVGVGEDGLRVVEAADEIFSCGEVDAGFAADGGVDLGEESGGDLHVADAAHVDGGEEAGDVADDAATEGEEERVAVGACGGELVGEGFDAGEALVGFAAGKEEDGWGLALVLGSWRRRVRPESPDVGRGDDEGPEGFVFVEFFEARIEGAEEVRAYGDVVVCGGRVDGDDGHGISIVAQSFEL